MMFPYFTRALIRMPVALAYVGAIIVCVVLLCRRRDWPSLLALLGFGLLLIMNVLFSINPFFEFWMQRRGAAGSDAAWVMGAAMLMESTVAALAIGCLVLALWMSLRRT